MLLIEGTLGGDIVIAMWTHFHFHIRNTSNSLAACCSGCDFLCLSSKFRENSGRERSKAMVRLKLIEIVLMVCGILVCSSWMPTAYGAKKQDVGIPRKEDVPYIKCQVCEKLAFELNRQVENKKDEISPKKISEFQIIEIAENICNLKKAEADWILKIDIVEQGERLELVEQPAEGQCNSECKTIERACQEVIGYSDTDVAEYVYSKKPQLDALIKYICKDLTKACSSKPPPVPKDRIPGEVFVPKEAKEAEMEKMLKSMQGMPGAPNMKMYSREDLMNMNNLGDEDADDDEDDDEEQQFPSTLGKALRQKKSAKDNWKQKITNGIADATQTLKRHANKVSNKVKRWWKTSKISGSAKKPKEAKSGKSEL